MVLKDTNQSRHANQEVIDQQNALIVKLHEEKSKADNDLQTLQCIHETHFSVLATGNTSATEPDTALPGGEDEESIQLNQITDNKPSPRDPSPTQDVYQRGEKEFYGTYRYTDPGRVHRHSAPKPYSDVDLHSNPGTDPESDTDRSSATSKRRSNTNDLTWSLYLDYLECLRQVHRLQEDLESTLTRMFIPAIIPKLNPHLDSAAKRSVLAELAESSQALCHCLREHLLDSEAQRRLRLSLQHGPGPESPHESDFKSVGPRGDYNRRHNIQYTRFDASPEPYVEVSPPASTSEQESTIGSQIGSEVGSVQHGSGHGQHEPPTVKEISSPGAIPNRGETAEFGSPQGSSSSHGPQDNIEPDSMASDLLDPEAAKRRRQLEEEAASAKTQFALEISQAKAAERRKQLELEAFGASSKRVLESSQADAAERRRQLELEVAMDKEKQAANKILIESLLSQWTGLYDDDYDKGDDNDRVDDVDKGDSGQDGCDDKEACIVDVE